MAADLNEFFATHKPKGFKPIPHYSARGDCVTFYARDERCHAKQADDVLTVYRSMATGDIVGCKIDGVRKLIGTAGSFGVKPVAGQFTLGVLLLVGLAQTKDESQRKSYYDLKDLVENISIGEFDLV
jgi:hypothetical protein